MAKPPIVMIRANTLRPSIPSSPAISGTGRSHDCGETEGANNRWKLSSCQTSTTLTLACYNAQAIHTEDGLFKL